jgi:hypothetical protein
MSYQLSGKLLGKLRVAITETMSRGDFVLFANDYLDIKDFLSEVRDANYPLQIHEFLLSYEYVDLARLCTELRRARPASADLVNVIDEILADMAQYPAVKGARNTFLVGGRLFLNRKALRDRLELFARGSGIERMLVVSGDLASGKSHSSILITHQVDSAKPIAIDLPATAQGELEAEDVAGAITSRIWPAPLPTHFDDLRQRTRDSKLVGDELVQRLSTLDEPTLLVIDRFDSAHLSPFAKDLLIRLCRAVELRECPNLWLVLIGLDVADLAPNYDSVIEPDQAGPPNVDDIAEFLVSVTERGKNLLAGVDVRPDADSLAGILGNKPTYDSWRAFERELKAVSTKLRDGGASGG